MNTALILGSAFHGPQLASTPLTPQEVHTQRGSITLWRTPENNWVVPRHGFPHATLPHQIPWRTIALAIQHVGCTQALLTSSVGVLDANIPIMQPLAVSDILMLDNRLPDGSACTMFTQPSPEQGHLVLEEGLINSNLKAQLYNIARDLNTPIAADVLFGYVAGPRTKTRAENRLWASLGAQTNSMTLGPELVLLNELEIPCVALVVGHKYSLPGQGGLPSPHAVTQSLDDSKAAMETLLDTALRTLQPTPFRNSIYRFQQHR